MEAYSFARPGVRMHNCKECESARAAAYRKRQLADEERAAEFRERRRLAVARSRAGTAGEYDRLTKRLRHRAERELVARHRAEFDELYEGLRAEAGLPPVRRT